MITVRVVIPKYKLNFTYSLKIKILVSEWSNEVQSPKKIYNNMPVADLNGMSYATLSNKLMELKNLLTTLERNGKLSQRAVYECADKVFEYPTLSVYTWILSIE